MSWATWSVGLLAVLLLLLFAGWNRIDKTPREMRESSFRESVCMNEDLVLQVQRDQWAKATMEVFGSERDGIRGSDMDFYKRTFGVVEALLQREKIKPPPSDRARNRRAVDETERKRPFSTLVYYRIFKSANDNIRSLLTEFVYADEDQHRAFAAQNCYNLDQHCVSNRIHYFTPSALKYLYVNKRSLRFPFTFVRDPIDRFVSAVSEVEHRARTANVALPFQNALGSQLRFQEFVKLILSSGGSRSLFQDFASVEMEHIAPAIATLLLAHKVEDQPLRTFRIERFDEDWRNLSTTIEAPLLDVLHHNRTPAQRVQHASSSDLHGTTLAAKSFLSYSSADSYKRFGTALGTRLSIPPGQSAREYEKLSRIFLVAICRIYLMDFVCLNYSLPSECQDLPAEMHEVISDHQRFSEDKVHHLEHISDLLRFFVPKSWLSRLAVGACLFTSSPECEARFVYEANELNVRDRHEEL